jgi:hypothetical protein
MILPDLQAFHNAKCCYYVVDFDQLVNARTSLFHNTRVSIMSLKIKVVSPVALALLISACSGSSLFPQNNDYLTVTTTPSGASVFVMQEAQGNTPTKIDTRLFYPATLSTDQVNDYGRITLKHDGCEDKTLMVNAEMISQGLNLKLNCGQMVQASTDRPEPSSNPIKKRLQQLQALRDENLISDSEFEKIRQKILEEL